MAPCLSCQNTEACHQLNLTAAYVDRMKLICSNSGCEQLLAKIDDSHDVSIKQDGREAVYKITNSTVELECIDCDNMNMDATWADFLNVTLKESLSADGATFQCPG